MSYRITVLLLVGISVSCDDSLPPVDVDDDAGSDSSDGSTGCTSSNTCVDGYYCKLRDCSTAGDGVCTRKPEFCPEDCPGVCGCDGRNYCNGCEAARAGWSVDETNSCVSPPPPPPEGCFTNNDCPDPRQYCHIDGCVASEDQRGKCLDRPTACDMLYAPVCGCDGSTYGNECEAHSKGVNIKTPGACGEGNCATDAECPEGAQWCEAGICVPCDNGGDACDLACPVGWAMYERNGCRPCRCAPTNECTADSHCAGSNDCYAGAFCWDWCPPGDPSCCYGNLCSSAGCPAPPPVGCKVRGCPLGQSCDLSGCSSSNCQCSSDGEWNCTPDCNGGTCTGP